MAVDLGTIRAVVTADTGRFDSAMRGVRSTANSVGTAVAGTAAAVTALGASMTVVSINNARQFEQSITEAASKTEDAEAAMVAFEDAAMSAGLESAFSASEAADALGLLAQSGLEVEEATNAVSDVLNLASAGAIDLATATNIATGVMQGFGLTVEDLSHVNDVLAKTSVSASTDVQQLGQAMSFAAPTAAGLGVEIEEVSAVMGLLADSNIKAGRAGTSFNAIIGQMSKVADELGADLTNADIETLGFAGSLDVLTDAGLTSQNALDHFGQRAGPALQALLSQGTGEIRNMREELENAGGTAEEIARQQLDTLDGAMTILGGTVETLSIQFGQVFLPPLQDIVEVTQELTEGLTETKDGLSDMDKFLADSSDALAVASEYAGKFMGTLIVLGGLAADTGLVVGTAFVALADTLGAAGASVALTFTGEIDRAQEVTNMWLGDMGDHAKSVRGGFGDSTRAALALSNRAEEAGDKIAESFRRGGDEIRNTEKNIESAATALDDDFLMAVNGWEDAVDSGNDSIDETASRISNANREMDAFLDSSKEMEDSMDFTVQDVEDFDREEVMKIVGEPTVDFDDMFPTDLREKELGLMEAQLSVLTAESEIKEQLAMLDEAKAQHAHRLAEIEAENLEGVEERLEIERAHHELRGETEGIEARIAELHAEQAEQVESLGESFARSQREAEETAERVADMAGEIESGVSQAASLAGELASAIGVSDDLEKSINGVVGALENAAHLGTSLATGDIFGAIGAGVGVVTNIIDLASGEEENFDRQRARADSRDRPDIAAEVKKALDEAGLSGQQLGVENNYFTYDPVASDRRDVQSQRLKERADRARLLSTEEG